MLCNTEIKKIDIIGKSKFYFSGICGSGMSALAFALNETGKKVAGSDRIIDQGKISPILQKLRKVKKIKLYPQNGTGVDSTADYLVLSSAIEEDNPDVVKAKELNIPVIHRTDVLLALIKNKFQIAVAGSSGKTTSSALTAHILKFAKMHPSYFIGGFIKGYKEHESVYYNQKSKYIVMEADESDRTIKKYTPNLGAVLSLCKDHYGVAELEQVFHNFALCCKNKAIINGDDAHLAKHIPRLQKKMGNKVISFGVKNKANVQAQKIKFNGAGSEFYVGAEKYRLNLPGLYNIYNALAAITIAKLLGIKDNVIKKAVASFKGVKRRFELVASIRGITVIDDFAHNPDKIKATILAAKAISKRVILIYQPHGFYPVLINKNNLVRMWERNLRKHDVLILPDIYYPGGKIEACADKVSSHMLIKALQRRKVNALYINDRNEIIDFVKANAKAEDIVIIMGARDPSLSYFAKQIADELGKVKK